MASQVWASVPYLLARSLCWILLFAAALLDGLRHVHVKARGRQLYGGVIVVLGALVVQDVLLLFYSVTDSGAIFSVYIFFTDAADSLFTALLLVIAAGFCITRDNLGPYKAKVIAIPTIYFISILIVDYIMDAVRGRAAFNVADFDEPGQRVHLQINEVQRMLLVICALVNILALVAAWIMVFDTIAKEREMLEMPEQDVYAAAEAGRAPGAAVANGTNATAGHAVLPPPEVILQEENQHIPNLYGNVTVEDLDGPKTVEEKVAKASKIRLLRQFSYGVIAYVIATALVVLLPIFVTNAPGEEAVRVVLIMQNVVLFIFMAGLAWIFRLRNDNPYLMLEEDGPATGETGEVRTELGVLASDERAEENGDDSPHSMQNYSLDDGDEPAHRPPAAPKAAAASSVKAADAPAASAVAATRQAAPVDDGDGLETIDLGAEAEDVKMMKGVPKSDA